MTTSHPPPSQRILVTGATGNQGLAVINALLQLSPSPPPFQLLALTRSPNSPKAKSVAAKSPSIRLLKGDLDDCPSIFASAPDPITTVFSVQADVFGSPDKVQQGEIQGRALVDAAVKNGVRHIVQSTGDRGGPENSKTDPTNVPQFVTKFHVEQHLMVQAQQSGTTTWTILRPVTFMENVAPDIHGKGFATMWANSIGQTKRLQLVSTKDVGTVAAKAMLDPGSALFRNRAISLAGDELTQAEASAVFEKVFGKPMPMTLCVIGRIVQWQIPEVRKMFEWFAQVGFKADVGECREMLPGLMDFETWLREESGFRK